MKKLAAALIPAMLALPLHAAPGDIAGDYYTTDIVTSFGGAPITSYNIGGKTCIDAEILNWYYGFDVYWYADTRRLEISDKGTDFVSLQAGSGALVESRVLTPGNIAGQYYETDIVTTLNGRGIESYNIGGRTMICAEAMREFGYDVIWDGDARTLEISRTGELFAYETDFGRIRSKTNKQYHWRMFAFMTRDLNVLTHDGQTLRMLLPSKTLFGNPGGYMYIRLKDLTEMLGGTCTMTESMENGEYVYTIALEYDTSVQPTILTEWDASQDKTTVYRNEDADSVIFHSLPMIRTTINGEPYALKQSYGGKVFASDYYIINNELYIPSYTLAELFGCKHVY